MASLMKTDMKLVSMLLAVCLLVGCGITPAPDPTPSVSPTAAFTAEPTTEPTATEMPDLRLGNKIWNPSFDTYTEEGLPLHWDVITYMGDTPALEPENHPQHHFGGLYWPPSLKMSTTDGAIDAAIVQRVTDLQSGVLYYVSCWMFAYAGNVGDKGEPSEGDITLQLGIDPYLYGDILWGPGYANMIGKYVADAVGDQYGPEDLFIPYTFAFVAQGEEADFYIHAYSSEVYQYNSVFIDRCVMEAVGWD